MKKAEKKKRKSENAKNNTDNSPERQSDNSEDKLFTVSSVLDFVSSEFPKAVSKLKINIKKLIITVGGDDASKIALNYGKLSAAVSLIIELLDNKTQIAPIKDGTVAVYADFLSEKNSADFDFSVKISVGSLVAIAFGIIVWLIKNKFGGTAKSFVTPQTASAHDDKTA